MTVSRDLPVWRQRLVVAHEICHLVFDPPGPEHLDVALDSFDIEPWESEPHEARARGFSAELLLPRLGLLRLLGTPRAERDLDTAQKMVERASEHFGTSWDVSVYHLYNHGFIARVCLDELLGDWPSLSDPPETTLPAVGEPPLCLQGEVMSASTSSDAAVLARRAVSQIEETLAGERADRARSLIACFAGSATTRPMRAAVDLSVELDRCLAQDDVRLVEQVFKRLDPYQIPGQGRAMVNLLAAMRKACLHVGPPLSSAYEACTHRALDALEHKWSWDEQDISDAEALLL